MAALVAAFGFSSANAVGLGPLTNEGTTNSERKGFYLTLINPYSSQEKFRLYSIGYEDETPVLRVLIPVKEPSLGPKSQRRMLVIDTKLVPGEVHRFRVCAERVRPPGEELIHARVCSKLTARRVA